jgi:hypothetical protein
MDKACARSDANANAKTAFSVIEDVHEGERAV